MNNKFQLEIVEIRKQTPIEWFYYELIHHGIIVVGKTTYGDKVKTKHQILFEQAKEMEKDQMELTIIKICAEQSTSEASKYAQGYKEGYKRALELTKWTISNLIPPHNEQQ
jgi:hypothetical protein